MAFCNIDANNRVCEWNDLKQEYYLQIKEDLKEKIKTELYNEAIDVSEFVEKRRTEASSALAGLAQRVRRENEEQDYAEND